MSSSGDYHSHGHGSNLGTFSLRMGCSNHGHQSFQEVGDGIAEGAFGTYVVYSGRQCRTRAYIVDLRFFREQSRQEALGQGAPRA